MCMSQLAKSKTMMKILWKTKGWCGFRQTCTKDASGLCAALHNGRFFGLFSICYSLFYNFHYAKSLVNDDPQQKYSNGIHSFYRYFQRMN